MSTTLSTILTVMAVSVGTMIRRCPSVEVDSLILKDSFDPVKPISYASNGFFLFGPMTDESVLIVLVMLLVP
eukprot:CAMPEP_0194059170 /NCGR_PEP_ID=MMETSP0009_2-20130614/68287_1 /TAXON_ID=210454 /ORGANISM="Grammatophora oceanica, Strain CCMP 410" /LENGTH=71 /DNA_ID=CAMNT_0038709599 /DNA_START=35 /DNA_END=247 /DNA_ORIENTATION=+